MRGLVIALLLGANGVLLAQSGWTHAQYSAPWGPRGFHSGTTLNGQAFILGGLGAGGDYREVWSSFDGAAWAMEADNAIWGDRNCHESVSFSNRLWLLGGRAAGIDRNDVYSSVDGATWVTETPNAPWVVRAFHSAVVFNGKMWVIGGLSRTTSSITYLNDVWSSTDGVNWAPEVFAAAWSPRAGTNVVVFNGRLWTLGGTNSQTAFNDVWSSADGINWTQEVAEAPWSRRYSHRSMVYNGKLWVLGGRHPEGLFTSVLGDVWSSVDGISWVKELEAAPWGPRSDHVCVVHNDRLWVLGGGNNSQDFNDVWSYGMHLSPTTLPAGRVGVPYSATLEAREGQGPCTWTILSVSPPAWLAMHLTNAATMTLTGTPTSPGSFGVTIKVEDSNGNVDQRTILIPILAETSPTARRNSADSGCIATPQPHLPYTAAFAAALYALTRRRRFARPRARA